MWDIEIIDVEANGSCFFESISIAITDCIQDFVENDYLCLKMDDYIKGYEDLTGEDMETVSPHFIRYICSRNIDECIFETYSIEAADRKDSGEKNVKEFKSKEEMSDYIINTNCWADHSIIRSFFKSFGNRCALVIFDETYGGLVYFQKEWTYKKDKYICLNRQNNHYSPVRFSNDSKSYPLCLERDTILSIMEHVNNKLENNLKNVY